MFDVAGSSSCCWQIMQVISVAQHETKQNNFSFRRNIELRSKNFFFFCVPEVESYVESMNKKFTIEIIFCLHISFIAHDLRHGLLTTPPAAFIVLTRKKSTIEIHQT